MTATSDELSVQLSVSKVYPPGTSEELRSHTLEVSVSGGETGRFYFSCGHCSHLHVVTAKAVRTSEIGTQVDTASEEVPKSRVKKRSSTTASNSTAAKKGKSSSSASPPQAASTAIVVAASATATKTTAKKSTSKKARKSDWTLQDFHCDECDKKYFYKRNLVDHMKKRHPKMNYMCQYCDQEMNCTKEQFEQHIRDFHPMIVCDFCNETLRGSGTYKDHINLKHGGNNCAVKISDKIDAVMIKKENNSDRED